MSFFSHYKKGLKAHFGVQHLTVFGCLGVFKVYSFLGLPNGEYESEVELP